VRKGSSHVGSPDYNAVRSHTTRRRIGNASEKAVRRMQRRAERLLKSLLESGPRGSGLGEVTV
jgi:hypothetical protein